MGVYHSHPREPRKYLHHGPSSHYLPRKTADDKSLCDGRTQENTFVCLVCDSSAIYRSISLRDPCDGSRGQIPPRARPSNRDDARTSTNSNSRGESCDSCEFSASSALAREHARERSSCACGG